MFLKDYETWIDNYNRNILRLHYFDGINWGYRDLILTSNSGKIVWRSKALVKHTGIELGICALTGIKVYIHNHPTSAGVVDEFEFSQGHAITYQVGECSNPYDVVIMKGLDAVIKGVIYRLLSSNCHQFTSNACHNTHSSPPVDFLKNALGIWGIYQVGKAIFSSPKKCRC